MVFDGKDGFSNDGQAALQQQVVNAHDRTGQRVFHGGEKSVGNAFRDGPERGIKRGARHGRNGVAKKLNGSGFAEGAGFALEGNPHRLSIGWAHRQALSCNMERETKRTESIRTKRKPASPLRTAASLASLISRRARRMRTWDYLRVPARYTLSSQCACVRPSGIIPASEERILDEQTRPNGIR